MAGTVWHVGLTDWEEKWDIQQDWCGVARNVDQIYTDVFLNVFGPFLTISWGHLSRLPSLSSICLTDSNLFSTDAKQSCVTHHCCHNGWWPGRCGCSSVCEGHWLHPGHLHNTDSTDLEQDAEPQNRP